MSEAKSSKSPNILLQSESLNRALGADAMQILRCGICMDFFEVPIVLPCGHTFCLQCLTQMCTKASVNHASNSAQDVRIGCPNCRVLIYTTPILRRNVTCNFIIQSLIECLKGRADSGGLLTQSQGVNTDPITSSSLLSSSSNAAFVAMDDLNTQEVDVMRMLNDLDRLTQTLTRSNVVDRAFMEIEEIRKEHITRERERQAQRDAKTRDQVRAVRSIMKQSREEDQQFQQQQHHHHHLQQQQQQQQQRQILPRPQQPDCKHLQQQLQQFQQQHQQQHHHNQLQQPQQGSCVENSKPSPLPLPFTQPKQFLQQLQKQQYLPKPQPPLPPPPPPPPLQTQTHQQRQQPHLPPSNRFIYQLSNRQGLQSAHQQQQQHQQHQQHQPPPPPQQSHNNATTTTSTLQAQTLTIVSDLPPLPPPALPLRQETIHCPPTPSSSQSTNMAARQLSSAPSSIPTLTSTTNENTSGIAPSSIPTLTPTTNENTSGIAAMQSQDVQVQSVPSGLCVQLDNDPAVMSFSLENTI